MPSKDTPDYIDDILTLVAPVIAAGETFLALKLADFETLGAKHGLDCFDVLADCMDAYNELRIVREIEAGHEMHVETSPLRPIEELVGLGMITEGTDMFTVDDFIGEVECGRIAGREGYGEFVSGDAEEFLPIRCHAAWLREFRDEWPYIAWYGN